VSLTYPTLPAFLTGNLTGNEPRPDLSAKVSFASLLRSGTESEGWYVDLPYAIRGRELLPFGVPPANSHPNFESTS
jgi:hypothetical protein